MARIHQSQIDEESFGVRVFLNGPEEARELERVLSYGHWYGGRPIKSWKETPARFGFDRPSIDVYLCDEDAN